MEEKPSSVLEKLDKQDEKLDQIIGKLENNNATNVVINKEIKQSNSNYLWNKYLRLSKKEYLWSGPYNYFKKSKYLLCIFSLVSILLGIVSTIFTTTSFGLYSTFSLFENIEIIFVLVILVNAIKTEKRCSDKKLCDLSIDKFTLDPCDVMLTSWKEKKKYKIFRILSYIAIILNILMIWCGPSEATTILKVFAMIFEILYGVSIFFVFKFSVDHYCMYSIICFNGKNESGFDVVIYLTLMDKKFYSENDFQNKFQLLL